MPELPDVEAFRRYLDDKAMRRRVDHVRAPDPRILKDTSPQGLGRALAERRIRAARRHGKLLFAGLEGGRWLAMHFGMTGHLAYLDHEPTPDHTCLLLTFDNEHQLAYVARRRLGYVRLVDSPETLIGDLGLGPDACGVDQDQFMALTEGQGGGIKAWLMDQHRLAGIGNVWSDEILFQAGIHPLKKFRDLDQSGRQQLYDCLVRVLDQALDANGDPGRMPAGFLLHRRHSGADCPGCGGKVENIRAAGRSAWLCPRCQPP